MGGCFRCQRLPVNNTQPLQLGAGFAIALCNLRGDRFMSVAMALVINVLPFLVAALLALAVALRLQFVRRRQAEGVMWLQSMRVLLGHIQQHRGLSAGIMAGQRALLPQLDQVQQAVSRDLVQVSGVGRWIKDQASWQAVTVHWAKLAGRYGSLGLLNNLEQHTRLIQTLMVFMADIASLHHLDSRRLERRYPWRACLELAELVGQLRAFGTALAAGGEHFEYGPKARQTIKQLCGQICKDALVVLPDTRVKPLFAFVSDVESGLLAAQPSLGAEAFFAMATLQLEAILTEFDRVLAGMRQGMLQDAAP